VQAVAMSVIVTNAKNRIAYNVVRSLGQKGIELYTADFVPRSMSFASRYSKAHFLYPSPFRDQEGFVQCLSDEIQRLRVNVLIPVFEETFLVAKHMDRLSKYVSMVLPTYDKILIAHNKDRWAQIARRLEIPVPRSCPVEELQTGAISASDLRYPVLIKPKQGGGGWGIRQVESAEALRIVLNTDDCDGAPWSWFFVQEKICGETHCVAMLMNRGQMRARVAYRQLRDYPVTGGQATMRISIRSGRAEAYFQQLLETLSWHGVCQADFVVDKRTQIPYLIDLNPRLWGSLAQAIASGVDFPYLIYRLAREGDVATINGFKTGVVTRWIGGELGAFFPHLKRSKARLHFLRTFFFPPIPATLYDDFSLVDPLPFAAWLTDALLKAFRSRSLKPVTHDSLQGIWE
jgi:predicted ATP-grasp superfamily ATP-dependent carboligase